jgi:hypothetical protein
VVGHSQFTNSRVDGRRSALRHSIIRSIESSDHILVTILSSQLFSSRDNITYRFSIAQLSEKSTDIPMDPANFYDPNCQLIFGSPALIPPSSSIDLHSGQFNSLNPNIPPATPLTNHMYCPSATAKLKRKSTIDLAEEDYFSLPVHSKRLTSHNLISESGQRFNYG